jgi:hypothetical protein
MRSDDLSSLETYTHKQRPMLNFNVELISSSQEERQHLPQIWLLRLKYSFTIHSAVEYGTIKQPIHHAISRSRR